MNLLAYVHLRNVFKSTGAGRVARNIVEALAGDSRVELRILADQSDHRRMLTHVGRPWTDFSYVYIERETSSQQARWIFLRRPTANFYWRDAQIVYCTGESYVPKGTARLAVTAHDTAFFENDVHEPGIATLKQRWKWKYLYRLL